jgi:predicted Zn finger-like uncharacterized protein
MPISVTCPECSSTYRVADDAAGKAIKCKKCGARVPVPATDEDGAAGAADAGNGEAAAPKKKSNKGLIIGLVVGLVAFCCICAPGGGGLATWYFWPQTPKIEIKGKDIAIKDNPFKDIEKALKDNPFKDATKKK